MRKFKKLNHKQKVKRILFCVYQWFNFTIKNFFYWIRTHTYNKYHIINIKAPEHGYKWGWIDRDNMLFLACFKILCDFVEKELYDSHIFTTQGDVDLQHALHGTESWEYITVINQFNDQSKIFELYNWFKYCYPSELEKQKYGLDYDLYELETLKLKELINMRPLLWT